MKYKAEDVKKDILNQMGVKELQMDDTFEFGCKMCGNCCRNRSQKINITGLDLYNIAKAQSISTKEAFEKYTSLTLEPHTELPYIQLVERLDGSCRLLRKGKCMIQEEKPVVCRLYPLGRACDTVNHIYFEQGDICRGNAQKIKVRDWLESFKIFEVEEESVLWARFLKGCSSYLMKLQKKPKRNRDLIEEFKFKCILAFYINYDMSKTFLENLKFNMEKLKEVYPQLDYSPAVE